MDIFFFSYFKIMCTKKNTSRRQKGRDISLALSQVAGQSCHLSKQVTMRPSMQLFPARKCVFTENQKELLPSP